MLRWENYFLKSGDNFNKFWKDYQNSVALNMLYILGVGFDPRTTNGIKTIYNTKTTAKRDTIALRYYNNNEDLNSEPDGKVSNNFDDLNYHLITLGFKEAEVRNIFLRSDDNKSIASINATNIIHDISSFENYTDIVIDISAMPRSIFIPLINKSLDLIDSFNHSNSIKKNLHIVVCENSKLDSIINDRGLDEEASYIHGFRIKQIDKTSNQHEVWIPILGEKQTDQFDKIKLQLQPAEICPVVPFPSENLRRGDNLITEYQEKLFNDSNFEPKNIVYVDESNPFQVYRLLNQTINRYKISFDLLSGCKIIVSALSSKLLTIGAFLAVFEIKREGTNVGLMHVESLGTELDQVYDHDQLEIDKHNKLFEIWVAGEPYNEQ